MTGTSMSSPLIAGVISRLLAYDNSISRSQVYSSLSNVAVPLSDEDY